MDFRTEPSSIMPKGDLYAETMLRLKNGNEMLLPFNLYPDGEAMRGWHQIVSGKKGERKVTFTDKSITVSGWPRADRSFNEKLGLSGFGFNGHGLMGKSDEYLATMYGYFRDEHRYSLVMVESTDGLAWKFRSLIAGSDCPLVGGELITRPLTFTGNRCGYASKSRTRICIRSGFEMATEVGNSDHRELDWIPDINDLGDWWRRGGSNADDFRQQNSLV